ncbi:uroporphyrinogen decarboxylase family protein [Planctomycetota bacterium]
MSDFEMSCKRIIAAYNGEILDRVPILSPISWHPLRDIDEEKPGGWRTEEHFIKVAHLVQEHCDIKPPYNKVKFPGVYAPYSVGYQRFCEAPAEFVEKLEVEDLGEKRTRHTFLLHTPKGDLRYVYDLEEGIETSWDREKPIKSAEDVEKMLSVPFSFEKPDSSEYEPFRKHREEMGELCIGGSGVNSMVAMLCGMMSFQLLLEWVITEPGLIKGLADAWLERTSAKVEFLLSQGVGPFWHFNGVERASPPMMGPKQWEDLVVPYDGKIMQMIKEKDPESKINVHCHGRVGTLLDSFIEMGADALDPMEPPPQGDIELGEAKKHAGGRLTFYGNMEFVDMETCTPDQIEEKIRKAIEEGGKEHTILFPSATPHEKQTEQFTENAIRYIEAGLKYGVK